VHFYQFNIADYRKDTGHLTPIEHYIYRELLDMCYLNEIPINGGLMSIRRRLKLADTDDLLIQGILDEFFIKTDDGYINNRVNLELSRIYDKSEKARESVKKRWDKVKSYERNTSVYERNTNDILPNNPIPNNPIPNTQNTSTKVDVLAKPKKQKSQKTSLPENFGISADLKAWAEKNNYTRLEVHLESFIEKCKQHDYKYADWDAALKTAIRADWAKARDKQDAPEQRKPVYFVAGGNPQANKPVNIKEILLRK